MIFFFSMSKRSDSEKTLNGILVDLGTDDDDLARDIGSTGTYVGLTGNVVEMDPFAVFAGNDAL